MADLGDSLALGVQSLIVCTSVYNRIVSGQEKKVITVIIFKITVISGIIAKK